MKYCIVRVELDRSDSVPTQLQPRKRYEFWSGDLPFGAFYTEVEPDAAAWRRQHDDARRAAEAFRVRTAAFAPRAGLTIDLVICTRDRPTELARCLASLSEQTRRPDRVIVVDNASAGPDTREVARAAGATYVREDRPGLDVARNSGAAASSADILAYTDDDVVLHPRWTEAILAAFDSPHIQAVTGLVLPAELQTEAQAIFEREWGFGRGFRRRDFTPDHLDAVPGQLFPPWLVGAGATMAFRRSVFAAIGDFDPRLDVGAAGCSGDSEFWYRILHYGGTCRYEPSIVAWHHHRKTMDGLKRQIHAYMSGHVASVRVQWQRTGRPENQTYLLRTLPRKYFGRAVRRTLTFWRAGSPVFWQQVAGLIEGARYDLSWFDPGPAPSHRFPPAVPDAPAPLVSVVIPAFNAARTLTEALTSVVGQTYPALEIIVVDDGSTDETAAIADDYAARDPRFRVIRQANAGVAAARNRALAESRGVFVAPIDADDLWHTEKVERQVRAMQSLGEACVLVYCSCGPINAAGRIASGPATNQPVGYVLPELMIANIVGGASTPLMRLDAVRRVGGYDPTLRDRRAQGCEDLDLYLRLAEIGEFGTVPETLTGSRMTRERVSGDLRQMLRSYCLAGGRVAERNPDLARSLEIGTFVLGGCLLRRALYFRRVGAAAWLWQDLMARDPRLGLRMSYRITRSILCSVPRALIRRLCERPSLGRG